MQTGNDDNNSLNLQHPDLPTIAHAVLVIMVGIGVLFFMADMLTDIQNLILTRLVFLLVPIWACYMFQFDVHRTLFLQWPGVKSLAGVVLGTAGLFITLVVIESMLWNLQPLRPSPDDLEKFARQMNKILGLEPWKVILLICVATPISEEILFRGFFLRSVKESLNITTSVVLVGILFGLAHFTLKIKWIPMSLFGIYLGCVAWLSKSIFPCMLIHACFNTGVLVSSGFSMASMKPDTFIRGLNPTYKLAIVVGGLVLMYASLQLFRRDRTDQEHMDDSDGQMYKLVS